MDTTSNHRRNSSLTAAPLLPTRTIRIHLSNHHTVAHLLLISITNNHPDKPLVPLLKFTDNSPPTGPRPRKATLPLRPGVTVARARSRTAPLPLNNHTAPRLPNSRTVLPLRSNMALLSSMPRRLPNSRTALLPPRNNTAMASSNTALKITHRRRPPRDTAPHK